MVSGNHFVYHLVRKLAFRWLELADLVPNTFRKSEYEVRRNIEVFSRIKAVDKGHAKAEPNRAAIICDILKST